MLKKKIWISILLLGAVATALAFSPLKVLEHYLPEERALLLYQIIEEEYQMCPEINPLIVLAIIKTESDFRNVYGDNGKAVGYMQIHQETMWYVANFYPDIAEFTNRIKFSDLIRFPGYQIRIGYRYLCLIHRFICDNDIVCTISRYNGDKTLNYYERVLINQLKILEVGR